MNILEEAVITTTEHDLMQNINLAAKDDSNIHEPQLIASEIEVDEYKTNKKQKIYDLLQKMEMGNTESSYCLRCNKLSPRKGGKRKGSDDIKTVYTPPPTSNVEVRGAIATEQRETAFFDKTGDPQDHYFKHFAHGLDNMEGKAKADSVDETDISADERNDTETPSSHQDSGLLPPADGGSDNGDVVLSDKSLEESQIDDNALIEGDNENAGTSQAEEGSTEQTVDGLVNIEQLDESHESEENVAGDGSAIDDTVDEAANIDDKNEVEASPDELPILGNDDELEGGEVGTDVTTEEMMIDSIANLSEEEELDEHLEDVEQVAQIPVNPAVLDIEEDTPTIIETPEPISALAFSITKNKLAVATTLGSLKVFILDMFNQVEKDLVGSKIEPSTEIRKPDSMVWGIVTKTPTIVTRAHVGAINSVYIEDGTTAKQVATIITTGEDSYIRLWEVCIEANAYIIKLLAAQRLTEIPIAVVRVRNTNGVLVGYEEGRMDLWNIGMSSGQDAPSTLNMMLSRTKQTIDAECDLIGVEVSKTGKYIALCSTGGWIVLYNPHTLELAGIGDCKNRRGLWSNGANVTGIDWNKSETLMLVTTSDSRIRLLTTKKDEDDELIRLEKFKGHTNTKFTFKAQFGGVNDEYVICACEKSFIYIWKHHIDPNKRVHTLQDVVKTNSLFIRFNFVAPTILPHITVFNPGEWNHIKDVITNRRKNSVGSTDEDTAGCACLPMGKRYIKPQNIDVTELDTQRHILLTGIQNHTTIRYSVISVDVLQSHFG